MTQITDSESLLIIIRNTLEAFSKPDSRLSAIIQSSIRVAQLRSDFDNLTWLRLETLSAGATLAIQQVVEDVRPHFTKVEFSEKVASWTDRYNAERIFVPMRADGTADDKPDFLPLGVAEVEEEINRQMSLVDAAKPPMGLTNNLDIYMSHDAYKKVSLVGSWNVTQYRSILHRIGSRVHDFLAGSEHQLVYGQINSDIFEQNRRYVDTHLSVISPKVLEQFSAAYRRMREGDVESRSHAAESCRRILKSLADHLYPSRTEPVIGSDGKQHIVNDERYISRLRQFVYESIGASSSGKLLLTTIEDIGNRIEQLNNLASKGVHSDLTAFEVNQCVIQTYILVGDLLRVSDE